MKTEPARDPTNALVRREVVRTMTVAVSAVLVAAAVGSGAGVAVAGASACKPAAATSNVRLPAPVTVTTDCGAFQIGRDGTVRRTSSDPSPVPQGASWWPYTGVWDKLAGGHLVVGRWQRGLWRSSGRFPIAYEVGAIVLGPHALAFSYGSRTPRLYFAALSGRERQVASGEYPLGWTRGGVYTRAGRGGELLVRSATGTLRAALARHVYTYAFNDASGSLYFLAHGRLVRADGAVAHPIASLARLGLTVGRSLQLQPLGRLVALRDRRRLVVLREDGSMFASTPLPRGRTRVDDISSQRAPHRTRRRSHSPRRAATPPTAPPAAKPSTCSHPARVPRARCTPNGSSSRSVNAAPISPGTAAGCSTAQAKAIPPSSTPPHCNT